MKKTIKMSALMLTMFAAIFMVACGGSKTTSPEVNDVVSIIDNVAKYAKNADSMEDATKIMTELGKLVNYTSSDVVLTKDDAKAIVNSFSKLAKIAGNDISKENIEEGINELTGESLGHVIQELQDGFDDLMGAF